jgi:tetrapyrrole methylase family protein/MazG family protein
MADVDVVGLGPAGLDRLSPEVRSLLDTAPTLILRTARHPAAGELLGMRDVVTCDDLYESADDFDGAYSGMVDRVMDAARSGPVVFAVPGSPSVGERAASAVVAAATAAGFDVCVHPAESFLDLVWARTGIDPVAHGVQILDGRDLPDPMPLHLPTVITQVDTAMVLDSVAHRLSRVLSDAVEIVVLDSLGGPDESVETVPLPGLADVDPGPRTTLALDPGLAGWHGLVVTNRILRSECPWDREQTHHSLISHLIEEAYETVEAVSRLSVEAPGGEVDYVAYAEVEEELGDLLLQVVFHATLAEEAAAFDVETVAEGIRRKLVRRHPHVFGDVAAETAHQVKANWEQIKQDEKDRSSLMDDVPDALPAIARAEKLQNRAASVGFDWPEAAPVFAKLEEEVAELEAELTHHDRALDRIAAELGDVLFSVVNLARHAGVDAELALRAAADRFAGRFREVEQLALAAGTPLAGLTLAEMDELWDRAKRT